VINHFTLLFLLITVSLTGFSAQRVERLFWDKHPLKITLPVGKERLVSFPSGVRAGIPTALAGKLRTQINQGTVYWLAKEPFETQRIEVREINGKHIYLIDLQAKKTTHAAMPVDILPKQDEPATGSSRQASRKSHKRRKAPGYVTLTRFAAHQLYALKRLLRKVPGIHRVSVSRAPIRHLLRGHYIKATPLASWQAGRLYVTAVELNNLGRERIDLDPRDLRGQWRAATFQHNLLYPAGSEADTTAVYLISDRPFQEVL